MIDRLAYEIMTGRITSAAAVADIRDHYENLFTRRDVVGRLKQALLAQNRFHPQYERTLNDWGDTVRSQRRRDELRAFALMTLKKQLLVQKRCQVGDQQAFSDRRDCAFVANTLRIAPDYVAGIALTQEEYDQIDQINERTRRDVVRNPIDVNALPIVHWARDALTTEHPTELLVALAVVTGRRGVELLTTGSFAVHDARHVVFDGHTKPGLTPKEPYKIPVLGDARRVVDAWRRLASVDVELSSATKFVRTYIHPLMTFRHLRMLYGLVTYEAFRPHRHSKNSWLQHVLGQEDIPPTSIRIVDTAALRSR